MMSHGSNDNARRERVERQLEEDARADRRRYWDWPCEKDTSATQATPEQTTQTIASNVEAEFP